MGGALEKIQRGYDSSGRRLLATRQMFQHFDRVNKVVGGVLVPIQGSFNIGTTASAGTHDLAGAFDVRSWNLSTATREKAMRAGRDPAQVGGAAWWYRTWAQGFDPHIHLVLLGDDPMTPQTQYQADGYRRGTNGLASGARDDFWRPSVIRNYQYIEDDMYESEDRNRLKHIETMLSNFVTGEVKRDKNQADLDKKRFERYIAEQGRTVDLLTKIINETKDDSTKTQLRRAKKQILSALKDDPDVTGPDNPSDDAMEREV